MFIERLFPHPCQIAKFECVVRSPTSCDDTASAGCPSSSPSSLPDVPTSVGWVQDPIPISGKNLELGEDLSFNQAPRPKETPLKMYKAMVSVLKGLSHTVLVGV